MVLSYFLKGPGMSKKAFEKSLAMRNKLSRMLVGAMLLAPLSLYAGHLWGAENKPETATTAPATQPADAGAVQKPAPKPITEVYYYDIITGKLFPAPVAEFPPIATPDKSVLANGIGAGVKANVFSCGECKEGEWYIGYLETYLPKAKEKLIQMNKAMEKLANQPAPAAGNEGVEVKLVGPTPQDMMVITEGHLVAEQEAIDKWYVQESPEGAALVNKAMKKCQDGKYPIQCFPGR